MRKVVVGVAAVIALVLAGPVQAVPIIAVSTCVSAIGGGYMCISELSGKQFHCQGWDGRSPGTATNCTAV